VLHLQRSTFETRLFRCREEHTEDIFQNEQTGSYDIPILGG
jgi:hypothetical protein